MRWIGRAALIGCLLALSACGVPSDGGPRATPPGDRLRGPPLVGCVLARSAGGVPSEGGPRAIPQGDVPFDLLAAPTTSPPTTQFQAREIVPAYLIGSGRLALATRGVHPP